MENKSSTIICNALAYIRENKIPAKDYFTDDYLQELATNDMYTLVVLLSIVPNLPLAEKYCKVICDYYADQEIRTFLIIRINMIRLRNIHNNNIHKLVCTFFYNHRDFSTWQDIITWSDIKVYGTYLRWYKDTINLYQPYFDKAVIFIVNDIMNKKITNEGFNTYKLILDIIGSTKVNYCLEQHIDVKNQLSILHQYLLEHIKESHYLYPLLSDINTTYERILCA